MSTTGVTRAYGTRGRTNEAKALHTTHFEEPEHIDAIPATPRIRGPSIDKDESSYSHGRKSPSGNKRLKGMEGNGFYNKHSRPQGAANALGIPLFQRAIQQFVVSQPHLTTSGLNTLYIGDFGSSQGRNSVPVIRAALEIIPPSNPVVAIHVDLPTNDFNSLLQLVQDKHEGYTRVEGRQVFAAVRGQSFYERNFPNASIHLAWSAIATHWLSKTPANAPLDHPYAHMATHPNKQLWVDQAREDWFKFVEHRSYELVSGGQFVQVGISRSDDNVTGSENPLSLLNEALAAFISKEQLATVQVPVYARTKDEWLAPFRAEPSKWVIKEVHQTQANNPLWEEFQRDGDVNKLAEASTGVHRAAVFGSLVYDGPAIDIERLTQEYKALIKANPERGRFHWLLTLLHVERR